MNLPKVLSKCPFCGYFVGMRPLIEAADNVVRKAYALMASLEPVGDKGPDFYEAFGNLTDALNIYDKARKDTA